MNQVEVPNDISTEIALILELYLAVDTDGDDP